METDFGKHQVCATNMYWVDFCAKFPRIGLLVSLFVTASFNIHIIHHLLPTCDLSKQHLLIEPFFRHARKHEVLVHKLSFSQLLVSTVKVWSRPLGNIMYAPPQASLKKDS